MIDALSRELATYAEKSAVAGTKLTFESMRRPQGRLLQTCFFSYSNALFQPNLIAQNVLIKRISQLTRKMVNFVFSFTYYCTELTVLWGIRLSETI